MTGLRCNAGRVPRARQRRPAAAITGWRIGLIRPFKGVCEGKSTAPRTGCSADFWQLQGGRRRKRGGGRNGVCQSPSGGGGEEVPAPADLTKARAVPSGNECRLDGRMAIPGEESARQRPPPRTAMKSAAGLVHQTRAEGVPDGRRYCGPGVRRANQMISANTTPTATMAATVAIRALGRVSIMRGFWKWLPGTGSNRRPSD